MKKQIGILCLLALCALVFSCKRLIVPGHGESKIEKAKDVQLVKISKDSIKVYREFEGILYASIYPEDAEDSVIVWQSLDESIATVNDEGLVLGVGEGQTKVIALSPKAGIVDSCVVTVLKNVRVEGVSLNQTACNLYLDEKLQLEATVKPADARVKDVTWASSDEEVATVDENGLVKPLKEGNVDITVTTLDKGLNATCKVRVMRHAVIGVSINKDKASLPLGGAVQLEAVINPENATIKDVTWASSNTAAATVSQTGMVSAVAPGTTDITVTTKDGGFKATCVVTVKDAKQMVLTFDLTSNPGGWPTAAHTHYDGGTKVYYTLGGTKYTFILADCNGASKTNVYYTTKSGKSYVVMATKYRYFGMPAIPEYKLTKVVGTHATASASGRTVGIAGEIEGLNIHPGSAQGHPYVKGGEPFDWAVQDAEYTYQLSDTEANKVYYIYLQNSGVGISKLVLTYDPE